MSEWRTVLLLTIRPLDNDHPEPGDPPRLGERSGRVIRFMQEMAQKNEIERSVLERELFRLAERKEALRHIPPGEIDHFGAAVYPRHINADFREGNREDSRSRADVQQRLHGEPFPAERDNPLDLEARQALR